MGLTFEGSSNEIIQDAASVNTKANTLAALMNKVAKEVYAIDEQIMVLASNGLKGTAMTKAVQTYEVNRNIIDRFVRKFAAAACVLSESSIAHSRVNEESEAGAGGGSN